MAGSRSPLDRGSLDAAIADLKKPGRRSRCHLLPAQLARRDPRARNRRGRTGGHAGAYVALSSEVLPQIKEYDRVCTTVVNAYVGPALERYLLRLETRLREAGLRAPV